MRGYPVEYAEKPAQKHDENTAYRVLYDGQCEICQAWVSWLKALDRKNKTISGDPSARRSYPQWTPGSGWMNAYGSYTSSRPRTRFMSAGMPSHVWHGCSRQRGSSAYWESGSPFAILGGCYTGSLRRTDTPSASAVGVLAALQPETVRRQAELGAFWSGYTLGFFIRLPLVVWAGVRAAVQRTSIFSRTYHKRLDLLSGKLTILFLNGVLPNAVPLLFGELFTAVLYDGVAIDPGSPKMRQSLAQHLRRLRPKITKVVATHAHEEHIGNLNWLSHATGAAIHVSEMTAQFLTPFKKLPWVRATIIGQPPNLGAVLSVGGDRGDRLRLPAGDLYSRPLR